MLPTFSGRATHHGTLTPSLLCETFNARCPERAQKVRLAKRKCLRMGLERRQVSAFGFYWRRGSPLYAKTGSYIVCGQSRVYVISQQRSQENAAAGGGIGHESSQFLAIREHCVRKPRVREGWALVFRGHNA